MNFYINEADTYAGRNKHFKNTEVGNYFQLFPTKFVATNEPLQYISSSVTDRAATFSRMKDNIKLPIHLNESYNEWKKIMNSIKTVRIKDYEQLYPKVLDWVVDKQFDIKNVDVVCRRGILTTIGHTLYNTKYKTPWQFKISRYHGKCYITNYRTEPKEEELDEFREQACYWGVAFEEKITEAPTQLPESLTNLKPQQNIGCYSVSVGEIGKYKFLWSNEMDAIDSANEYVELKTSQHCGKNLAKQLDFRNKLSKVWLQCHLGDVPKVVYGLRNNKGVVNRMEEYTTDDLVTLCSKEWDPTVMMGFLNEVLDWALPKVEEKQSCLITYAKNAKFISMTQKDGYYIPDNYMEFVAKFADETVIQSDEALIIQDPEAYSRKLSYFHTEDIGFYINYRSSRLGDYTEMATYVSYNGIPLFPQINKIPAIELPINLNKEYEKPCENWESLADEIGSDIVQCYPGVVDWVLDKQYAMDGIDLVCSRGVLKCIGGTIYDVYGEEWNYKVCKYNGTCYMVEGTSEPRLKTPFMEQCEYWGVIFEDNVTTQPQLPEQLSHVASEQENFGYYSVTINMIGKYRYLSSCEVDAVDAETNDKIELKTAEDPKDKDDKEKKFRRNKLSNVWLQSYLAGVDRIVYGLRDRDGRVHRFKEYDTATLPLTCAKDWSAVAMLRFIETVLDWTLPQIEEGESYLLQKRDKKIMLSPAKDKFYLPEKYLSDIVFRKDDKSD